MLRVSRRRFLATAASGAAGTIVGRRAASHTLDANNAVRVGVVGLRGRGQLHLSMVSADPQEPALRLALDVRLRQR